MTDIRYRQAEPDDLLVVGEMYLDLYEQYLSTDYAMPQPEDLSRLWLESFERVLGRFAGLFLAEIEGEIMAFVLARVKRSPAFRGGVLVGEISDVWVAPEARRKGIAVQLCRQAVAWLQEQGVHSVETQILEGNDASAGLFQELGFQPELRQQRLLLDNGD